MGGRGTVTGNTSASSRAMATDGATRSEAEIQREIMLWLSSHGARVIRMNVGRAKLHGRWVAFGAPGMADLLVMLPGGRYAWVEVKSATGRQSEDQLRFASIVESVGGRYVLARSVDDVRGLIEGG